MRASSRPILLRQLQALALVSAIVASATIMTPEISAAQVTNFKACSQGTLANCANIRLTSTIGAGVGGSNLFQIGVSNLGSLSTPTLPTSIYFLSLLTGKPAVAAGAETDVLATPVALGGATVSNAAPWSIFETGDVIFLSAPGNDGIGNCATSTPVGGFGLMARTCGLANFISFNFSTVRAFDPRLFTLGDLEFVAIAPSNIADSCNDRTPCAVTAATTVPEPTSLALVAAGFLAIITARSRRQSGRGLRSPTTGEG